MYVKYTVSPQTSKDRKNVFPPRIYVFIYEYLPISGTAFVSRYLFISGINWGKKVLPERKVWTSFSFYSLGVFLSLPLSLFLLSICLPIYFSFSVYRLNLRGTSVSMILLCVYLSTVSLEISYVRRSSRNYTWSLFPPFSLLLLLLSFHLPTPIVYRKTGQEATVVSTHFWIIFLSLSVYRSLSTTLIYLSLESARLRSKIVGMYSVAESAEMRSKLCKHVSIYLSMYIHIFLF